MVFHPKDVVEKNAENDAVRASYLNPPGKTLPPCSHPVPIPQSKMQLSMRKVSVSRSTGAQVCVIIMELSILELDFESG